MNTVMILQETRYQKLKKMKNQEKELKQYLHITILIIGASSFDGYLTTKLPFHLDEYNCKTNYQKGMFWINSLKEIFSLLIKDYEFDKDKIERFLTYLESKYDDDYIYENVRTELAKHHE